MSTPATGVPTKLNHLDAKLSRTTGGQDTLVDRAGRDALRSAIAPVQERSFNLLGHDLLWQQPDIVAQAITDFLLAP